MPNITQQQVRININLDILEIVTCPDCENSVFKTNLSLFKRLPSIQSPTGQAQLIKIDLISCPICHRCFQIKDKELSPITVENVKTGRLKL